jgi:hypothetical protein
LQGLGLAPGLYSNVRVRVADDHGHSTVSASAQLTVQRAGDASGDGAVSFYDYLILQSNFGKTGMSYAQGDFNGDGRGSFADYLLLEQNFGKSANPPAPVPAAPALVPASMAVPAAKAAKVTSAQTDTVRSIQAQTMTLIAGNAKAVRPVRNSKVVRQVDSLLARNLLALDRLI